MGRIGLGVTCRLKAFGIDRVQYWGRSEKPEQKEKYNQLLSRSNYADACCTLVFKKMKNTANCEKNGSSTGRPCTSFERKLNRRGRT
ncbi:unnamed protein product [Rhizopus stolonifer]